MTPARQSKPGSYLRFATIARLVVVLLALGSTSAAGPSCEDLFQGAIDQTTNRSAEDYVRSLIKVNPASRSMSQIIRDNQVAYWATVRVWMTRLFSGLPTSVATEVIVVGDNHSGNYVPVLARGAAGKAAELHYTFGDTKDLGYGPALLDLNRLLLNTVEIGRRGREISRKMEQAIALELLKAYRAGLVSHDFRLTEAFADDLPSKQNVEKKIKKNAIRVSAGNRIETDGEKTFPLSVAARRLSLTSEKLLSEVDSQFKSLGIKGVLLDAVTDTRDRGGSKESIRILALFRGPSGDLILKEFKELVPSALERYQSQPARSQIERSASRYLDYDIQSVFPVVKIAGREFVLRDKKVDGIEVPYRQKTAGQFNQLMRMAIAHAEWTGTFHGRQLRDEVGSTAVDRFVQEIVSNQDEIVNRLTEFNRHHVEALQGARP